MIRTRGNTVQLSYDQVSRIDSALRDIAAVLPDIEAAKSCGIECQEHADMAAHLQTKLTRIKDAFGPKNNA